jgi:hypothetical protein
VRRGVGHLLFLACGRDFPSVELRDPTRPWDDGCDAGRPRARDGSHCDQTRGGLIEDALVVAAGLAIVALAVTD